MKNIYKLLLLVGVVLMVSSCDLTRRPTSAMDKETALQTVDDADKWSTQQMVSFRGRVMGTYDRVQDIQSDMLNAAVNFGNNYGGFHNWNSLEAGTYEIRDIYHAYYLSLKNINYFLSKVGDIPTESDEDKVLLNDYVGQAHFLRAYYYFQLALRYGTKYNAGTAASDLCVPLVLEEDPYAKPARATNKEVYDQIEADLQKASSLLAGNVGKPGSTYVTQDAISALRARVALYKNDFEQAYSVAKGLIGTNRYPLGKDAKALEAMWRNDTSNEDILRLFISRPDELPNSNNFYGASTGHKDDDGNPIKLFSPSWLPPQWVIDLYDDNDYRKDIYFEEVTGHYDGKNYEGLIVISKFKGNLEYATTMDDPAFGIVPNGIIAPKVFRIAETYLIAAEAGARTGKADAVTFLNALRNSRGLASVSLSGDALLEEIKDERTRELAYEGFRLFDLRRWNVPMERREPQTINGATSFLNQNPSPTSFKIDTNHNKWIWGLPAYELQTNPNLVGKQNPGWE